MASELVWTSILEADLVSAPVTTADPNVIDTRLGTDVVMSADLAGGAAPTMTVTVYYYDEASGVFQLTGDTFLLDPSTGNVAVANPNGLRLGFTTALTGTPTTANLNVGTR